MSEPITLVSEEQLERKTYTVEEVGRLLGLSRNSAFVAARDNKLPVPVFRVGKRMLVSRQAMDAYLGGNQLGPVPAPSPPADIDVNRRVPVKATISPQVHAELVKRANTTGRNISQEIEILLEVGLLAQRMITPP